MKSTNYPKSNFFMKFIPMTFLFYYSCSSIFDSDCVDGSGRVIEENRPVSPFESVAIEGSADFFFTQDTTQLLRVQAEDNILPLIKTAVNRDGTLLISSDDCYSTSKGVKVYASMLEVKGLAIEGSGNIKSDRAFTANTLTLKIDGSGNIDLDVQLQTLTTTVLGSGNISLSGRADQHTVILDGLGSINALGFLVNKYSINLSGSGECRIHVLDELLVTISGSGTVFYRGNPAVVNSNITGSGRLVKL